jgi:hypothetical protein
MKYKTLIMLLCFWLLAEYQVYIYIYKFLTFGDCNFLNAHYIYIYIFYFLFSIFGEISSINKSSLKTYTEILAEEKQVSVKKIQIPAEKASHTFAWATCKRHVTFNLVQ